MHHHQHRGRRRHLRLFLQDFQFDDWDELCDKLNALATDCNKHRAKTDKRKQRSVFRDVLKAVEVGDWEPRGWGGFGLHLRMIFTPPVSVHEGGRFPV